MIYIVHIQSSLVGLIMSHLVFSLRYRVCLIQHLIPTQTLHLTNYHDLTFLNLEQFSGLTLLFTILRCLKNTGQYFVKFLFIWFSFMFFL